MRWISPIYSMGTSGKATKKDRHFATYHLSKKMNVLRRYFKSLGITSGRPCIGKIELCELSAKQFKIPFTEPITKKNAPYFINAAYAKLPYSFASLPKNKQLKKHNKSKTRYINNVTFYESDAWRSLRYKALKLHGRRCMVCGATPETGAQMHVDHIKPRSKFPELELSIDNLQILCRECNLGKSNTDSIDWRHAIKDKSAGDLTFSTLVKD